MKWYLLWKFYLTVVLVLFYLLWILSEIWEIWLHNSIPYPRLGHWTLAIEWETRQYHHGSFPDTIIVMFCGCPSWFDYTCHLVRTFPPDKFNTNVFRLIALHLVIHTYIHSAIYTRRGERKRHRVITIISRYFS